MQAEYEQYAMSTGKLDEAAQKRNDAEAKAKADKDGESSAGG